MVYGECWFTGKIYFKHGGSQNATLNMSCQLRNCQSLSMKTIKSVSLMKEIAFCIVAYCTVANSLGM